MMKLILVAPATNATSERSFSTPRRLKTYLRSTMYEDIFAGGGFVKKIACIVERVRDLPPIRTLHACRNGGRTTFPFHF